jgi:hypothetical protein
VGFCIAFVWLSGVPLPHSLNTHPSRRRRVFYSSFLVSDVVFLSFHFLAFYYGQRRALPISLANQAYKHPERVIYRERKKRNGRTKGVLCVVLRSLSLSPCRAWPLPLFASIPSPGVHPASRFPLLSSSPPRPFLSLSPSVPACSCNHPESRGYLALRQGKKSI